MKTVGSKKRYEVGQEVSEQDVLRWALACAKVLNDHGMLEKEDEEIT